MIIVMKPKAPESQVKTVVGTIRELGFREHISKGKETTIIGVIGDERKIEPARFQLLAGVERVIPVLKPFRLASRDFQSSDTRIKIGSCEIGEGTFTVMAGPCAVESKEQVLKAAEGVRKAGAAVLRGGAFKPRTSPYTFQGLGIEGLKLLDQAKKKTGLPIVTEVMSVTDVAIVTRYADILQIGARNMQNFRLLEACGRAKKPVLLKRGLSSTIEEFLLAAEYIMSMGNHDVILCERGIRTFEKYTRNTLDISAVPVIKKMSHLPIVIDPSHAAGVREYVPSLAKAALAAGADGVIIEVHPEPDHALSDGAQSLNLEMFAKLMEELRPLAKVLGKKLSAVERHVAAAAKE
jgi:3-deoxy-7-phosphoheptulonate synthase